MSALRQLGWVFLAWVLSESRGLVGPKSFRCIEKCLKPERSVECYRCAHPSCVCQVEGNVPVPEVGEEQVMVRVVVAGINPVETYIREGGTVFWINQHLFCFSGQYSRLPELPYTPGTDAAGFVHQIGRRVSTIKVGCWVNDLQTPVTCCLAGWGPSVCIWQ